jgi:Carboxypeptidase regulatory-like domain
VTNQAGAPLADVRVRVAIPAADMRFVDASTPHKRLETRTDVGGQYRLEIPGLTERTMVSIDAMKPGYRRLAGTLMSGGDPRDVAVGPGIEAEASLILKPALYCAGVVVDEQGKPIPLVETTSKVVSARAYGFIEVTATNPDGSFEIFGYTARKPGQNASSKGTVSFVHPDYVDAEVEDIYTMVPEKRGAMRIVLATGYKVTGTVVDAAGRPVPNAMIKAVRKDGTHRKAALTDAKGRFALRGLSPGLTLLSVRALEIKQKIQMPMALNADKTDLDVRLRAMTLPPDLRKYSILGIQLTDVTPEMKSTYDLRNDRGALILDPGKESARLNIGRIAEGCVFSIVGNKRVGSVREFVDQILAETAGKEAAEFSIRVVYSYTRVDSEGSSTQHMKLTKQDLEQLRVVSEQLSGERP